LTLRLVSAAALLGCLSPAAAQTAGPEPSSCAAEAAQSAVGQPYSEDVAVRARQASGARLARKIEPGRAYTMEFSPDRLNLEVDARGVIRRVRCG
jgi:hypothetical protein